MSSGKRPSRPIVFLALLLAFVLLGCGAGATTATNRQHAPRPASHPSGPSSLAAEIDRAQRVIDDPAASPASLRSAARSEQLAFRELADRPRLRGPTLAQLSATARSAATASIRAAGALSAIVPAERHFPKWRIIRPPAPGKLRAYFQAASAAQRIPWQYLAAIELVETRMGRIRGLSPAGAQGPMQFMPSTWATYGRGNINNPRDAIMAAARFLAANGGRTSIGRALFHYNPSRSYVVGVEAYAREMRADARAFYGYYYWQVLYRTVKGTYLLPVGYPQARPVRLPG